jgi:hypothetical protein
MRGPTLALAIYAAASAYALILDGCSSPAAKRAEAAGGYAAQQLACVDRYEDRASIDVCRAKVREAWALDAGSDGAR